MALKLIPSFKHLWQSLTCVMQSLLTYTCGTYSHGQTSLDSTVVVLQESLKEEESNKQQSGLGLALLIAMRSLDGFSLRAPHAWGSRVRYVFTWLSTGCLQHTTCWQFTRLQFCSQNWYACEIVVVNIPLTHFPGTGSKVMMVKQEPAGDQNHAQNSVNIFQHTTDLQMKPKGLF